MACNDLCTAAKCQELEDRIARLESALELLEASFEAHTQQEIPTAHRYTPRIDLTGNYNNRLLNLSLRVDGQSDSVEVTIDPHVVSNLKLDGSFQAETLTLTIADGESFDTASILIPLPEIPEPEPPSVAFDIFPLEDNQYLFKVTVDGESDEDSLFLNPQEDDHVESNLRGSASYFNETLTISIADGESFDTFQVNIPREGSTINNNNFITEEIYYITEEIKMDCPQLEQELKDCCAQLTNLINNSFSNLDNQLANIENAIRGDITDVRQYVTVDISGSTNSNYNCEFIIDETTTEPIPAYGQSQQELVDYTGIGLEGIHANLKIINRNLDAIYTDICKAIDPVSTINIEDLYQYCTTSQVNRQDYFDELGNEAYTGAAADYEQAVDAYLRELLADSKYGSLIDQRVGNALVTAPNNWITKYLSDFALIQGKINHDSLCNLATTTDRDVISLVASDAVLGRATGKFLVLHWVTFDNYPKRSRNSSYWQSQIPQAKTAYDWNDDFLNLVWQRGNLYAELFFIGLRDPVSGYFADKEAANLCFDSILNLTNATEESRKYHERTNPKRNIASISTRPYRAFISEILDTGRTACHVKYSPPVSNE